MARRFSVLLGMFLTVTAVLVAVALPAWAAEVITVTWVRHAESTANAAGIIDTTVPGPGLTALGQTQALAIAEALAPNSFDGVYTSDMIRTQLTAAPLVADLGSTPVTLGGVREVNAGIFEGGSGVLAGAGYALPPLAWVLGARFVPVLGGEDGNGFDARVDQALAAVYQTGDTDPVVFSHGATIMAWTLMNVANPDLLLALTHPLGNTDVVVVTGNPEQGWTLQSWDGIAVNPDPGLVTKLFVAARTLVVAPQTSLYEIGQALRTGDPAAIAAAVRAGVVNTATAAVDFGRTVVRDVLDAIRPPITILPAQSNSVLTARSQTRGIPTESVRHRVSPAAAVGARSVARPAAATDAPRGSVRTGHRAAA